MKILTPNVAKALPPQYGKMLKTPSTKGLANAINRSDARPASLKVIPHLRLSWVLPLTLPSPSEKYLSITCCS